MERYVGSPEIRCTIRNYLPWSKKELETNDGNTAGGRRKKKKTNSKNNRLLLTKENCLPALYRRRKTEGCLLDLELRKKEDYLSNLYESTRGIHLLF